MVRGVRETVWVWVYYGQTTSSWTRHGEMVYGTLTLYAMLHWTYTGYVIVATEQASRSQISPSKDDIKVQ